MQLRKSAIAAAAAGLLGSGALVFAAHATTLPPTYSSPCGSSVETGPAPASPTLIGLPPMVPPGSGGEIGVIGPDGYIEAVGAAGAGGVSGHISGATAPQDPSLYGSIGNDTGSPAICVGSGSTTVHVP